MKSQVSHLQEIVAELGPQTPQGRGDFNVKEVGMLVGKFDLNP